MCSKARLGSTNASPRGGWLGTLAAFLRCTFLAGLLVGGIPQARGACSTNGENSILDLSTWSIVQYDVFTQPDAVWVFSDSNTAAIQTVNADASILLSPFILSNDQIQGSWQVNTNEDDDFIGFVFGYQDDRHFYLFDWKEYLQTNTTWGFSLEGMSVKLIHADTPLTQLDLGPTISLDTNRVQLLYHNSISWEHDTNYEFTLEFRPGRFTINVTQGGIALDTIVINDATYTSGQFGFYNFSQSQVRYAGFTRGFLSPTPAVSVTDNSVVEGDVGTTGLVFAVSLAFSNCEPVRVDYVITPGTATAGLDFVQPPSGTVVFLPGQTTQFVTVPVIGDLLDEDNETFFITLTNLVNALPGRLRATGTIIDDDPVPILRVDDVSIVEGNAGISTAVFAFTLSGPSGKLIRANARTTDGTAVAGSDYVAILSTSLIFNPGQTTLSLGVSVFGDVLEELDETFLVCLTDGLNVTLPSRCAIGTILNDDGNHPPTVQIIQPTDGAIFYTPPGLIRIEADAWDSDGVVERVDFFSGALFLGSAGNSPFVVAWTNNVPGTYVLTAIATDDKGATGTSAPVSIQIRICDPALEATPLANQTRCLCDEVEFSTTVLSPEPASFVWWAKGVLLPGQTNSTLLLQSLKAGQAGVYTVEIRTHCASTVRSGTLTLRGGGNQNPTSATNAAAIGIPLSGIASPYPSSVTFECVPGLLKHIAVTLDGLSHSSPDDIDVLLVGPGGQTMKLMSDCGGFTSQKLTNVVLTFTDTATTPLPDSTRISSGVYRPTNYGDGDAFLPPAPSTVPAADFSPFLATNPNGTWSLYVVDDQGGDSGSIARGWSLGIEWEDAAPVLSEPMMLPDGRFQTTLRSLPHMTHVIEASSDLATWTPVSTNTPSAPAVILIEPLASGVSHRFYRAVRCP